MFSNLRSLIFKLDPEKAHTLAIQSLKFNLVSNVFDENKNDPILKTQIFGKDLSNPIGIAAGFDKNGDKNFVNHSWDGNNVLLFGSEGFGMKEHTKKYVDFFVKININEDIESLNISNSAAIVFHHLSYIKKKS